MGKKLVSHAEILQVRTAMVLQYPKCFVPKGQAKIPLKIGIDKDLFSAAREAFPGLSLRLIRGFLKDYTGGANYHRCMVAGAGRVGLNGVVVDQVTDQDEAFHKLQLLHINNSLAKRKSTAEAVSLGDVASRIVAKAGRNLSTNEKAA